MSGPAGIRICAARPWNDTGIDLVAGRRYAFAAAGRWTDWTYEYGPEGGASRTAVLRLAEGLRRVPAAPWFCLIGAIGRDPATCFPIGAGLADWTAPRSGRLTCFANDVWPMYFNNRGAVLLRVAALG